MPLVLLLLAIAHAADPEPASEADAPADDAADAKPPSPWDFRMEVGAELGEAPFGVVNVGWRHRELELTIQWLTDTLDVRWEPTFPRGRAWVAARAEALAAGLFLSSWDQGRRTPERDFFAFYEGAEAGAVGYIPGGMYAGGQVIGRYWHFLAGPRTTIDTPGARFVGTFDGILGFYHDYVHIWVRGGADYNTRWSPHVHGELVTSFPWIVRPIFEARAGWADFTDDVNAVRLGGLNPYVVPLAGASWAEFRVEDYAAGRLGIEGGPDLWTVGATWDGAWFDGTFAQGFALHGRVQDRGRFIEASLGYAPWLPRPGSIAMTGWIRAGVEWGEGLGPRDPG